MAASVSPLCSSFRLSSGVLRPCCTATFRIHRKSGGERRFFHRSATRQDAIVISGTAMARQIHKEIQRDVEDWVSRGNPRPHLSVILVGDDPASRTYVRNKTKVAAALGISSETLVRPSSVSQDELLEMIYTLNRDWRVSGLLVQLPLPAHSWTPKELPPQLLSSHTEHINERAVCNAIAPEKDVDGFHIVNIGKLCLDQKSMVPATPAAVWEILKRAEIQTAGRTVLVAGRSKNVGMPIAMLLHTDGRHERPGGIPHLITADMVKEGAAVIDVGINRIEDPNTGKIRLIGDVDFEEVRKKAGFITPVPGGVGPMTVAMLMKNTVTAARNALMH
ncbi:probable bifunctional methylenetetrahydrofolate dehydrogenase/cyclohydrolase 2 isoform X3 [Scleropages formosus]|uniref:probable bifunctional methylenetetrahydrofolate dehydrogenase/cyclohydrolase 2 isoform X3 n=1 Tax=Scleropages formosus TaxID=113540 RepID=UPI00087822C1|nr:probable bifunctional methylenetetrahydrofolate dehydrogenase/cyclohydrolase 2 isoform X3 [Scleropages formosus]